MAFLSMLKQVCQFSQDQIASILKLKDERSYALHVLRLLGDHVMKRGKLYDHVPLEWPGADASIVGSGM